MRQIDEQGESLEKDNERRMKHNFDEFIIKGSQINISKFTNEPSSDQSDDGGVLEEIDKDETQKRKELYQ